MTKAQEAKARKAELLAEILAGLDPLCEKASEFASIDGHTITSSLYTDGLVMRDLFDARVRVKKLLQRITKD